MFLKIHFIFLEVWSFENLGILNLSARDLGKYLSQGIESWSADRGCWVHYLIEFLKPYHFTFPELWPFENL